MFYLVQAMNIIVKQEDYFMAYDKENENNEKIVHRENVIFVAVIIFSIFMIALDYGLIIKFINVIKNI